MNTEIEALESFESALKLVELEYNDVPDGPELVERIRLRLQNAFDNPPIEAMEIILQQRLSYDQARITLFRPLEEQIQYYPLILYGTISVPSDHPLDKLRSLIISLIYLSHRKSWGSFLEEFIISGGINSLVPLLSDKNLYLRGQVMEIFMNITDCDTFDWFEKVDNKKSRNYILHIRLLQLAEHPDFLKNLLSNRTNSYPGGSFRALQMLAFWMSWVRSLYTEDQKLQLSTRVLDELYLWSSISADDKSEEEMKLAQTVYDDFSSQSSEQRSTSDIATESTEPLFVSGFSYQVPSIDIDNNKQGNETSNKNEVTIEQEVIVKEKSVLDQVKDLKERANELYKNHNYDQSLELYADALDLLQESEHDEDISSIEVTLHFNRAASLWMISKELREGKVTSDNLDETEPLDTLDGDSPGIFELLRCEHACKAALSIHKTHVKSAYRLANVLLLLGKVEEALQMIDEVLDMLANNPQSTVLDEVTDIDGTSDQIKILKKMRTKCLAALIVRNDNKVESLVGSKTAKILNQLQSRNKRENEGIQHAWNGKWTPPSDENDNNKNENDNNDNNDSIVTNSTIDDIYKDMIKNDNNEKKKSTTKVTKKPKAADVTSKPTKVNKKLMEFMIKLKRLAASYESGKEKEAIIKDARSLIKEIWNQSLTVYEVIDCSLEENILVFLFNIVHDQSDDSSFALTLLNETMKCQRVDSQTRLALSGNNSLKQLVDNIIQKTKNDKLLSLLM